MRVRKVQNGCSASRGRWVKTLPATWNREMVRATRFLMKNMSNSRITWYTRNRQFYYQLMSSKFPSQVVFCWGQVGLCTMLHCRNKKVVFLPCKQWLRWRRWEELAGCRWPPAVHWQVKWRSQSFCDPHTATTERQNHLPNKISRELLYVCSNYFTRSLF